MTVTQQMSKRVIDTTWWETFKIVIAVCMLQIAMYILMPRDDSDGAVRRSNLTPRHDALTGCEYLEARTGLTPRLDAQGKQICRSAP